MHDERVTMKLLSFLIPVKKWRNRIRKKYKGKSNPLVERYLYGKNGIEIGGSGKSYGLERQKGSYANVDIIDAKTRARNKGWEKSQLVNILASGDDLPFKNEVFDYVFNSHVIEHFFDPLKAIEEWFRVLKKGGYICMVIPYKDRTFDRNRDITDVDELMLRNTNRISCTDYAHRKEDYKWKYENEKDKDHHILIKNDEPPEGWKRFEVCDFEHHWSVWNTTAFIELCEKMNWSIVDFLDVDEQQGHEFTVLLRKK